MKYLNTLTTYNHTFATYKYESAHTMCIICIYKYIRWQRKTIHLSMQCVLKTHSDNYTSVHTMCNTQCLQHTLTTYNNTSVHTMLHYTRCLKTYKSQYIVFTLSHWQHTTIQLFTQCAIRNMYNTRWQPSSSQCVLCT